MIFVGRSEPLLAVGWIGLALLLMRAGSPHDALQVLLIIALAEAVGSVMVPHRDPQIDQESGTTASTLEQVLAIWILIVVGLGAGFQFDLLPLFSKHPLSALCLAALCLFIGVLRVCQLQAGRFHWLISGRMVLLTVCIFGMQRLGVQSADVFLLGAVLLLLTLMLLTLGPVVRAIQCAGQWRLGFPIHVAAPAVLRQADLLMLPLVLPIRMMLAYLVARGLAAGVSLTLDQLMVRAYRAMSTGTQSVAFSPAEAARVNLGVLLVGGATALALSSGLTYLPAALGPAGKDIHDLTHWLILATLGPVIFGAAPMLLGLSGLHREMTAISLLGIVAFGTVAGLHPDMTPRTLAQISATVQLATVASASAVLAWRTGVWPGLTAVLFRQIKFF